MSRALLSLSVAALIGTVALAADGERRPYMPTVENFPTAGQAVLARTSTVAPSDEALPAYLTPVLPDAELTIGVGGQVSTVMEVRDARRWMADQVAQWFTGPDKVVTGMVIADTGDPSFPMCIVHVHAARSGDRVAIRAELDASCPR